MAAVQIIVPRNPLRPPARWQCFSPGRESSWPFLLFFLLTDRSAWIFVSASSGDVSQSRWFRNAAVIYRVSGVLHLRPRNARFRDLVIPFGWAILHGPSRIRSVFQEPHFFVTSINFRVISCPKFYARTHRIKPFALHNTSEINPALLNAIAKVNRRNLFRQIYFNI